MSWKLEALIGTSVYNLSDGSLCWVQNFSGVGLAPLHDIEERAPTQHGTTYIDQRFDPRIIQLVLGTKGSSDTGLEANLEQLAYIFRAAHGQIKLRWTLYNDDVRQIDCKRIEGMDGASKDKTKTYWRTPVTFKANDPTFYDPDQLNISFSTSPTGTPSSIPFFVPVFVGSSSFGQSTNYTYLGSVAAYPVVRIVGPIENAKVRNSNTDEQLFFNGVTIANGDYYEIDCRFGYKTITDSNGNNRIATLDEASSDLATFHLAPDSEVPDGVNTIEVTGTSVTGTTKVFMRWYNRYDSLWG